MLRFVHREQLLANAILAGHHFESGPVHRWADDSYRVDLHKRHYHRDGPIW